MSVFSSTELKKRSREDEREEKRIRKRFYSDLRFAVDRLPLQESDWRDLIGMHHEFGKEGPMQLRHSLIPSWRLRQDILNGAPMPDDLLTIWGTDAPVEPITRKVRSDKGKRRG